MSVKNRNCIIGGLLFVVFIISCVVVLVVTSPADVEADGAVPIRCPDGYMDCYGTPVSPTPEPTLPPTVTPEPSPAATPSPYSCRHTHDGEIEYVHFGWVHYDERPAVGAFDDYDPERCGHD